MITLIHDDMLFDHPQTPQSPSQILGPNEISSKVATSPQIPQSLPTPAHSINGSMSSTMTETMYDEVSHKRKRDVEDHGDQEQKKVHVEDSRLSIEDLHLDVGEKYLVCKTPITRARPDLRQDMFTLYKLEDIAKSIARTNPDGSKGVKLRKTYKNHIKDHGLSGSFDSVKREMDAPDTLFAMMIAPEEEWNMQYRRGREVEKGLSPVLPNITKALTMARGAIPKGSWNSSVLGELLAPPAEPAKHLHSGNRTPHPQNSAVSRTAKLEVQRPKRSGKKRTYNERDFEGYGEGYVDDDSHEAGYSTGEGEGLSRKRPKKAAQTHGFQSGPRSNSYGPGMVGA